MATRLGIRTAEDEPPEGPVTDIYHWLGELQWVLVDPSGAELTFSLYDVQKGVEIPKSYFYIDPTYRAVDPAS